MTAEETITAVEAFINRARAVVAESATDETLRFVPYLKEANGAIVGIVGGSQPPPESPQFWLLAALRELVEAAKTVHTANRLVRRRREELQQAPPNLEATFRAHLASAIAEQQAAGPAFEVAAKAVETARDAPVVLLRELNKGVDTSAWPTTADVLRELRGEA